jgi:hypothetical protein
VVFSREPARRLIDIYLAGGFYLFDQGRDLLPEKAGLFLGNRRPKGELMYPNMILKK